MQIGYEITNIQGIGNSTKLKLIEAGITSVKQLADLTPEQLSRLNGFEGSIPKKIIEEAQELTKLNADSIHNIKNDKASYHTEVIPTFEDELKAPPHEAFISQEEESSEITKKEKLSKEELNQIRQHLIKQFKALGYFTLKKESNLFQRISKDVDLIGYKIEEVNHNVGLFVFFPIKISQLTGGLLVSDENIVYQPTKKQVDRSKEILLAAQQKIFRNINKGGALFQLLRQILGNRTLSIRKTKDGKPLFIATSQKQYKLAINPILVSYSEPGFLEKASKFAYQRTTNVHIIKYKALRDLIQFLEKKEVLQESFIPENAVVQYIQSIAKLKTSLQKYSIPVLIFGIITGAMWFLENLYLLVTFTNLGIAVLIIYGIMLWVVYHTFKTSLKKLKAQFTTPRYLLPVEIDEIGILSIKDTLSSHELDQLIYEWFGKSCEFSCIGTLETEKTLEDQKNSIDLSNSSVKKAKGQVISKYSLFLEE